jgi:hypothetical protein
MIIDTDWPGGCRAVAAPLVALVRDALAAVGVSTFETAPLAFVN